MQKTHPLLNTFGYYSLFACIGLSVGITGPTIPSLAAQTNTTIGAIGGIFLAGPIGHTIGLYIGGKLYDRIKQGHILLGFSQLFSSLMIALIPFLYFYWILILINILLGFSAGFVNTGANTFLMWTHHEKAAPYMNGLHFFFGLGAFGAPFIFAQLNTHGSSYREAYLLISILAFLSALIILLLRKSPQSLHNNESSTQKISLHPYIPIIISAMLYLFFYVGSEITYGGWLFTYATKLNIASVAEGAYLTSGFWFAFTIGRLVSIPIAIRFKPEQIIFVSIIFCIIILGFIFILPTTLSVLWIITISLGFFMGPIWPSGYTMAGQSIKLTARTSSIILLGDCLGGMILPGATGYIIEKFGARMMTKLVLVSLIFNFIAFLVIFQQKKYLKMNK